MFVRAFACLVLFSLAAPAAIFSTVRGIVHDPSHRPVPDAEVTLRAGGSAFSKTARTDREGAFEFLAVPAGEYSIRVEQPGFEPQTQMLSLTSGNAPVVHFQLSLAQAKESVEVAESTAAVAPESSTPATLISRANIADTPGADLTNSMEMITNYVPGAYMTHDQLHVRGGHQVTWAIDGVPIPNTNIASNVGPQIDPKDIDYLEVQRGGYSADYGDRAYGVFNVVPRTGFERDREIEFTSTLGSFYQTNDDISIGDHTQKFAWFGSINGNRSNYGLQTPGPDILHDRVWGLGGFGSLIYNPNATNQFRFVTSLRSDDYQIPNNPGDTLSDVERERDAMATFTWVHTFSPRLMLTTSPFYHFNRANYDGSPNDVPISATQRLGSTYAGAQISLNYVDKQHNAELGTYGFAQHDNEFINLVGNDGSGSVLDQKPTSGHLEALFLGDQYKLTSWLTFTGGVRLTHFAGAISENAASPRIGAAIRIPRLNWILRGFFGEYYQAPPLSTVSGPVLGYAVSQGLGVIPLRGERDQENQVGLAIPFHGWTADINNFRMRATNYFDHNALGSSNVFFPISIAGARIWGTEVTLRSPRIRGHAQASITYSHQTAQGEGAVTGGLTDFSAPSDGWFFLDHDQRNTLHGNLTTTLPRSTWASLAIYYGSGFTDGSSDVPAHLQPHTTFNLSLGKSLGEKLSIQAVALNIANRRYLLDNSQTFGGTHYAEPRQIYVELRYRFHY
jgi:outer membrane receptor protein involved in Fe transport